MSEHHTSRYRRDVSEPRSPLVEKPSDARLYLCTDARRDSGDLAEFADAVLAGGVGSAVGGIDEQRLSEVLQGGARRVVVVRAITEASDPGAAARRLSDALAAAD